MTINISKILQSLGSFWMKIYRPLFFLLLFAACGLGAYVWYDALYSPGWSQEQKDEYNQKRVKEVRFQDEQFKWLVERIREKRELENNEADKLIDVFRLE